MCKRPCKRPASWIRYDGDDDDDQQQQEPKPKDKRLAQSLERHVMPIVIQIKNSCRHKFCFICHYNQSGDDNADFFTCGSCHRPFRNFELFFKLIPDKNYSIFFDVNEGWIESTYGQRLWPNDENLTMREYLRQGIQHAIDLYNEMNGYLFATAFYSLHVQIAYDVLIDVYPEHAMEMQIVRPFYELALMEYKKMVELNKKDYMAYAPIHVREEAAESANNFLDWFEGLDYHDFMVQYLALLRREILNDNLDHDMFLKDPPILIKNPYTQEFKDYIDQQRPILHRKKYGRYMDRYMEQNNRQ